MGKWEREGKRCAVCGNITKDILLHVFSECLEDVRDKDYVRNKEGKILDTVDKISEFFQKLNRKSLKSIVSRVKVSLWRGQ